MIANVMSIAGVDPSGGAGVLADVKTFSALGTYGMAVIAALTAQNTRAVTGVELVAPGFVAQQIDTIFDDVRVDAVKIGMLAAEPIIVTVANRLRQRFEGPLVLDPVMVAKSGDALLAPEAVSALRMVLLPLATMITPNLPEVGVLLDRPAPADLDGMRRAAADLRAAGAKSVLVKGGHLDNGDAVDLFDDGDEPMILRGPRIPTRNTHGTGCTLSAAIAAFSTQMPPRAAVSAAKDYLSAAIAAADQLTVGHGHGPVHHFHATWASKT